MQKEKCGLLIIGRIKKLENAKKIERDCHCRRNRSRKTDLSIKLARRLNAVIISADASQVYKELDIGTAKVTHEEMQGIPHYMMDLVNPDEDYSVGDFERL